MPWRHMVYSGNFQAALSSSDAPYVKWDMNRNLTEGCGGVRFDAGMLCCVPQIRSRPQAGHIIKTVRYAKRLGGFE